MTYGPAARRTAPRLSIPTPTSCVAALEDCGDDVVLVGHSYAGNTIPLVAARRPVRHLGLSVRDDPRRRPQPGRAARPINRKCSTPPYDTGLSALDDQMCQRWTELGIARDVFYFDCDEQTAQAALDRLRPQSVQSGALSVLTAENTHVCRRRTRVQRRPDSCGPNGLSQAVSWRRLAAELIELPGGHSPMLSAPPVLADLLLESGDLGVGLGRRPVEDRQLADAAGQAEAERDDQAPPAVQEVVERRGPEQQRSRGCTCPPRSSRSPTADAASTRLYSQPSLTMKKPLGRCTVHAATSISATKPAAGIGVSRPTARPMPAAISVVAAIRAWNMPGFMPMLSNQPAVPFNPPLPKNLL